MRDILRAASLARLRSCAASRPLVALDYDGTLAPIAARPDRARMRAATRCWLARLARQVPCVVLTGRRRADVARVLRRIHLLAIAGNHGIETSPTVRPSPTVATWRAALAVRLAGRPGLWIEDKRFSLSVHYRRARRKASARRVIQQAAARLRGARVFGGKDIVNIVPRGAPDKGKALVRLLARSRRHTVIYVGDDETDEPAFVRAQASGGLAIRVGLARCSAARYYLPSERHVGTLLRELVRASAATGQEHPS